MALSDGKPWAGLVLGAIAVLLQHQGLGDALHFSCGFDARFAGAVLGLVALLLAAAGAALSWRATGGPSRTMAQVSLMGAGLAALMVAWQTLAGFVLVPPCMP